MFERPLVTLAFDAPPDESVALARALAPTARTIRLVLRVPVASTFALGNADLERLESELALAEARARALEASSEDRGVALEVEVASGLTPDGITQAVSTYHPDVIVFGRFGATDASIVAGHALGAARDLRIPTVVGTQGRGVVERIVCPFDGHASSLARIGPFLRDRLDETHRVTLVALGTVDAGLPAAMDAVESITGTRAQIELMPIAESVLERAQSVVRAITDVAPDLIVVPTDFGKGIAPEIVRAMVLRSLPTDSRPVLFVPHRDDEAAVHPSDLDAFDAVTFDGAVVRLERVAALGAPTPLPDVAIDLVGDGRALAQLRSKSGVLRLPDTVAGPVGLGRHEGHRDPIHAIETAIDIVRSPSQRLALFDSRIAGAALAELRRALERSDRLLVAARVAVEEPARSIRARLRHAGFARALVIDVRDVLDEGDATDVPIEVAGVRLARAASRWRATGGAVDAVVTLGATRAKGTGFAVLASDALGDADATARVAFVPPPRDARARLDVLTGSSAIAGNSASILLDNDLARESLLALVDEARERLHAQWYIVEDDEVGRALEAALVRAAARGVAVRLLVDSLYSLHDSFGVKNPLLDRLGRTAGIEVRASNPIASMPSLEDLKRRDHRKLAIADGEVGIVSGRNIGNTYYRGFASVRLHTTSVWREVPWLDAGAKVRGPVVGALEASFLEAWRGAGGSEFPIRIPAEAGGTSVRFVVHRGLEDAHTLEAYLALIESARERLVVVNSFPLQLELQHAMLRAMARGVSLSMLVGHVRPVYGDEVPFAGGSYRAVADALVRARIAALVEAGADVREVLVAPRADWDPALGVVRPFVHAKLVFADDRAIAIGSANLDVTAGYWESEALLIVDDRALARSLEAQLSMWFDSAMRIDPNAPAFREYAGLRAWLSRVWPSFIG